MSGSEIGKLLKVTTFGESHGAALGCVIDGFPAKIPLSEANIQPLLDKRRPGQSKFVTQRQEADKVKILSGVFEGKTTGTPIALLIENQDQRSHDYGDIKDKFRPNHADVTWHNKFEHRDYRGGGRASARETAARVAAGAVCMQLLPQTEFLGAVSQIGEHKANMDNPDWRYADENHLFCADRDIYDTWSDYLDEIRRQKDSIGAICQLVIKNPPANLGEPVFDKLDAQIAAAIMSIPAVKAVEIGAGFDVVTKKGSQNVDEMRSNNKEIEFLNNNSGGILGGISTGQDITIRFALKPTSSILIAKKSVDIYNNNVDVITKGRHDPCVGIRAIPIAKAMVAIVLADFYLRNKRL